ncbi:hypothetical protein GOP47_0024675 [Adiantum capillus-veneris]|uniref:Uncharacterized protein n=1 Tax=Adiantum capillus-veneris TaxID=13818 RepID=A0A9D4U3E6_ADICA|nr:hypothetical protein GOP47_0024675 [Adiantum capillus-veneris]
MRGEIGKARKKKPGEQSKGNRFRREAEGRRRRTFSCSRLYGVDDEQTTSLPVAQQRDVLLAKAKHLAFPTDATGKYKLPSIRKIYARDVSAGGSSGLPAIHKSALDFLLNDLLLRHHWPKVAGVLSVLLRSLLAERNWSPEYCQHVWAAMEVTRQLEGLEGNDYKFRRMYQILHDKQPKGPWSRDKAGAGAIRLELALHLMSLKQFEDANLASEPFMDVPPYRDHSLANLVHGLIHYYQWFELIKQEVEQELGRRVMGVSKEEDVDFSEGVGENEDVFNGLHSHKADCSNKNYTFGLDDDFHSEDTSTLVHSENEREVFRSAQKLEELVPHIVKDETLWNIYDDAEEDFEKSYMKKARVLYNKDLDEMLFPFRLPRQYWGKDYVLSTQTATQKNSHSIATKHLRDTLSLENNSTAALLPLVQLMLAGADIEGAFSEIDKCCKKFSDCTSFRIKCLFLESLTPKNKEMLINAYEELLKKDPSSVQTVERLIEMHKAGNYTTEALIHQLGLHLDACPGSVLIWKKLALCFQRLKEADVQHCKEIKEMNNDVAVQGTGKVNLLQQVSAREEWKFRERWWLVKHFQKEGIEAELNAKGSQWLLFKAASAAHIYGPHMHYVLEAEKNLQALGNYLYLEKLQRHKRSSSDLIALLTNLDDLKDAC